MNEIGTEVTPQAGSNIKSLLPKAKQRERLRRWRGFKDGTSRNVVWAGGVSVIVALGLIFVYLFSEIVPMFLPASIERASEYRPPLPEDARIVHVSMERYREVAFALAKDGSYVFFRPATGLPILEGRLAIPDGVEVTAFGHGEPRTRLSVLGLSDGRALAVRDAYSLTYPDGVRLVTPKIEFPLGEEPLPVDPEGRRLIEVAIQEGVRGFAMAAATDDGRLLLSQFTARRDFMTGRTTLDVDTVELPSLDAGITRLLLSIDLRDLLVGDAEGRLTYYDVSAPARARPVDSRQVLPDGFEVSALSYLLGTVSIIVGGSDGSVTQWFLVRDDQNVRHLTRIRDFDPHPAAVTSINPEYSRKGFITADAKGNVALKFATSSRSLMMQNVVNERPISHAILAPRNDGLFALDADDLLHYYEVDNPHPQVSFRALWQKVWYEGRSQPEYVWQSSSATDEFEPKFSLVPMTLGTIKAAFYAMLFAMPLAIMGAIYSAYFMTPRMRGMTKPTIEIMEALPTVILGFLAGLWFAPFVERHLPAVFSVLILMPLTMLVVSFIWAKLPRGVRKAIPDGWEAAVLVPFIILTGWFCVEMSPHLEIWFFNGDMRQWLTDQGITYDQRNALVVGVAMGFAVIPTIFSIAEDAIFNVPRHLTQGSLALGATTWQTVTRVVLLTASPGIFSAVMIGLGRAVGETMIVLMATGNSPIVNFNIFEGMRTLSANIAVELPEAEFGGTHYRILFLSALVLFVLTFFLNTAAEIVRQRLRKKYASL
ncbi:MAG: ABC transporter permease subunit [Rhodospirillales bacterium]|nr:MAG: ABC transporter permease subunit [Rhodospirillales bacterium]